jgi:single-stranded DNA-binding protein
MIEASFTGFVQGTKEFNWGTILEVAHTNRKKNEAGEWETTSTDYIDVVVDKRDLAAYSHILNSAKGTRVTVKGAIKLNAYTNRAGEAAAKFKVYPSELDVVDAISTIKNILKPIDLADAPF